MLCVLIRITPGGTIQMGTHVLWRIIENYHFQSNTRLRLYTTMIYQTRKNTYSSPGPQIQYLMSWFGLLDMIIENNFEIRSTYQLLHITVIGIFLSKKSMEGITNFLEKSSLWIFYTKKHKINIQRHLNRSPNFQINPATFPDFKVYNHGLVSPLPMQTPYPIFFLK